VRLNHGALQRLKARVLAEQVRFPGRSARDESLLRLSTEIGTSAAAAENRLQQMAIGAEPAEYDVEYTD